MQRTQQTLWRVLALLVATSLLVVTACQQQAAPSPAAPAAAKPSAYKIGHATPLTGSQVELGTVFKNAADLAAELVNEKGGVDGVPLQVLTEDHMADPKQGITAFTKLVNVDKVPVVIAAWSSVIVGLSPTAQDLKTMLINYGANTPTVRGAGQYTFSAFPLADVDVKALARFLYNEKSARKLGVIYISNESGRVPAGVMKDEFERLGGKVVAFEAHEPDAPDFGSQLAKIKAANPDIIHIHSLIQEEPRIVKQIREMGMQQQLTSYSAVETEQMFAVAGNAAEGLIYTSVVPPVQRPEVQAIVDRYKTKFGKDPTGLQYVLYIADTVQTLIPDAIKYLNKKGLPYTGENVRQAVIDLKEFNTPLTGKTVFQFPGQDVIKPVTLKIINAKEKKFDTLKIVE